MYYILYDLKTLKVVHKDTKPLKPQNMNFYGIAEYNGELPKGDWLTVDNVRKEIETWKEKQVVENYDENGNVVVEEIEVEKSKTHIVCDLVAHFYPKIELTEEQKAARKEAQYEALTSKLIRKKYSQDAVEALYANYLAEPDNEKYIAEFNEFQAYRVECKAQAKTQVYDE